MSVKRKLTVPRGRTVARCSSPPRPPLLRDDGLRDLGEHRLKDLGAPERIYQLGDGDFPPLKTLYRTNLPVPATPAAAIRAARWTSSPTYPSPVSSAVRV